MQLPDAICLPHDARMVDRLIDSDFGEGRWDDPDWMIGEAILAVCNEDDNAAVFT